MPPPPPPPPPGPPPPPAAPAPPPVGNGGKAADRGALLNQIHKGAQLKKTVTIDKSAPILVPSKSTPGGGGGGAGKFNTVAVRNSGGVHSSIPAFGKGSVDDSIPPFVPPAGGLGSLFAGGVPLRPSQNRLQQNAGAPRGPNAAPLRLPFLNKQSHNESPSVPDGVPNGSTSRNCVIPPAPPPSKNKPSHSHNETDLKAVPSLADSSSSGRSENAPAISGHPIGSPCLPRSQPPPPPPPNRAPQSGMPNSALNRSLPTDGTPPSGRPLPLPPTMQSKPYAMNIPLSTINAKPACNKPPPPPSSANKPLCSPTDDQSEARFPPPPPLTMPPSPPNARPLQRQISNDLPLPPPPAVPMGRPGPPPPERTTPALGPARPPPPPYRVHNIALQEITSDACSGEDDDFVNRFKFHTTNEFPTPEPISKTNKTYPSKNDRRTSVRRDPPPPPPVTH